MNNLSQMTRQLQEIWSHLGINQKITIVVGALVVIGGMTGLVMWSNRSDFALLYGKLDEAEASKVIGALNDEKIPYRVGRGGSIMVPSDKVHSMRMSLAGKGIPRGEGVGFEIFDKPNFGISDFVQRANYLRAVQGELARTIGQVDSIEGARVMIVMPENRLLVDNQKKPTASVFVRVRGNASLPPQTVNAIRFLVANAVEGLNANSVTVVDNQGNVLSENNENDSLIGMTTTQLGARKNLEQYLSKKAEGMLEKVLGPGQAVVRVAADINFDQLNTTEERFDPDGQVVRTNTVTDENVDTTTSVASGGAPGTASNNTDTNSAAASPANNSRTRKKTTTSNYEITKITSNMLQTPGNLKRLTAAVFIASKMEGEGAERKPLARTPEEIEKLRRIVQSALGIQKLTDETGANLITLEEMPFNDQPLAELGKQMVQDQKKQYYLDMVKGGLYPALALGVLFFFWRTFKKTPVEQIPIGIPLGDYGVRTANGSGNGNGNGNGHGKVQKLPGGVVTVDVLNQLIRENPNNMSQAIRGWMARGKTK